MVVKKVGNITVFPNHSIYVNENSIILEKAEKEFVKGLSEHKLNISIAAFVNKSVNTALQGKLPKGDGLHVVNLGGVQYETKFINKLLSYVKSIYFINKSIKSSSFSYVFFPGNVAYISIVLAVLFNKKFGIYVRGIWKKNRYINWINKIVFKNADFVFTTGPAFRDQISRYNSKVNEVIPMVSFPMELIDELYNSKKTKSAKVVFVGRIVASKGIYDVIDALSILIKKGIQVELEVVGGGTEGEQKKLEEKIKDNMLGTVTNLYGYVSSPVQLAEIILASYIFVFPTTYNEGFPRVIYEAMLLGIPVITTDMPGAEGFLKVEQNCLISKKNDCRDLADKIELLLNDEKLHSKIKTNARKLVNNKFIEFKEKSHSEQVVNQLRASLIIPSISSIIG